MPKAELLRTDGQRHPIQPKNGTDFQLDELYKLLQCDTIEVVYSCQPNKNQILIIDEEGKLKHRQPNDLASEWFSHPFDIIVGDAILCDTDMLK